MGVNEEGLNQDAAGTSAQDQARYDLVISGGTAGGLSVAISSKRSGLGSVRVLEPTAGVAFPELIAENQLDVGHGETLVSVDLDGADLIVKSDLRTYRTSGCLIAERERESAWVPPIPAPASPRVLIDELPNELTDTDVLVVGYTDHSVELLAAGVAAGGRMVLAAGGMDPAMLSPAGEHMLRRMERDRRATVLYRAVPDQIGLVDEFPIAYFDDRRTPNLEFDYVVFASHRERPAQARDCVSAEAIASGKVWFLGEPDDDASVPTAPGWEIGYRVAEACFPDLPVTPPRSTLQQRARHEGAIDELRDEYYNATITAFEPTHSDLWILRVRPDVGDTSHAAGQYASLGLGYWEERIDQEVDDGLDDKWGKLVRRSYSISHPIFDECGYLANQDLSDELEFYIVLVQPSEGHVPALTPRLALKRPGDRIYLGPKVAGRYTLASVRDPKAPLVFFSTGTGEAPHNAMITELLRKGHTGPIVSAVTVRKWADLGYLEKNRQLSERYPNFHYLPMPTRESDVPKRYLQDLITDGDFDKLLGSDFSPERAHAFLCGNPAMIGLAEAGENGEMIYPEPTGVVELLTKRGFTLDKRGEPGNIHYEEYW